MAEATAGLLVIGDEVLSGRTRDAHVQYLGRWLNELGIRLVEARVLPDREEVIEAAVRALRESCTYLFTTGGIGPTHDDRTTVAIARAFGVAAPRHPDAVAALEAYYGEEGLNEARLLMARIPEGASLLENPVTGAPGYRIGNVLVLPGVPRIAQPMLELLRPRLSGGEPLRSTTIRAMLRESALAGEVAEIARRHPEVQIGSYPFFEKGEPGVSFVVRGLREDPIVAAVAALRDLVERSSRIV